MASAYDLLPAPAPKPTCAWWVATGAALCVLVFVATPATPVGLRATNHHAKVMEVVHSQRLSPARGAQRVSIPQAPAIDYTGPTASRPVHVARTAPLGTAAAPTVPTPLPSVVGSWIALMAGLGAVGLAAKRWASRNKAAALLPLPLLLSAPVPAFSFPASPSMATDTPFQSSTPVMAPIPESTLSTIVHTAPALQSALPTAGVVGAAGQQVSTLQPVAWFGLPQEVQEVINTNAGVYAPLVTIVLIIIINNKINEIRQEQESKAMAAAGKAVSEAAERTVRAVTPEQWAKLAVCIAVDGLGDSTFLLPGLGELADLGYGPLEGIILNALFKSGSLAALGTVEEVLPFTDALPTATIGWVLETFFAESPLGQFFGLQHPEDRKEAEEKAKAEQAQVKDK